LIGGIGLWKYFVVMLRIFFFFLNSDFYNRNVSPNAYAESCTRVEPTLHKNFFFERKVKLCLKKKNPGFFLFFSAWEVSKSITSSHLSSRKKFSDHVPTGPISFSGTYFEGEMDDLFGGEC
jgi:hypothetical protein